MKTSAITLLLALTAASTALAAAPDGYYDSLEGKKRTELRNAARDIVKNHKEIPYGTNTWDAFKQTDVHFVNGRQAWWDMYSDDVTYTINGHSGLNIEHSMPNSWWGGKNADYEAYCDIVNLNPADETANSKKSNYPLGEIRNVTWTNGVCSIGQPVSGQGGGASYVFEPADEYKGDFARQYMYMFTVYNDTGWAARYDWMYDLNSIIFLRPWASQLLLKWSAEDPVDQKEINRNNAIYKVQGNRNPFIDLPELADYIWGDKNDTPFTFGGSSAVDEIGYEADEVAGAYELSGRPVLLDEVGPGIYVVRYKSGKTVKEIRK